MTRLWRQFLKLANAPCSSLTTLQIAITKIVVLYKKFSLSVVMSDPSEAIVKTVLRTVSLLFACK